MVYCARSAVDSGTSDCLIGSKSILASTVQYKVGKFEAGKVERLNGGK